jgi:hypothetical protein
MNHWFDDLTRQLAADELSRRSIIGATTATLVAAAAGMGWPGMLYAAGRKAGGAPGAAERQSRGAPSAQANASTGRRPAAQTLNFGPCTATSNGAALKHELISKANANGKAAVLRSTRSSDTKGTTIEKTVLIDGKQQFQINSASTPSSKSMRLSIGDAFGFNGAELTSGDGGRTWSGKIDGRAIVPHAKGSGKKLQFVDGKPLNAKEVPAARDALKAVIAQHQADLKLCAAQVRASSPPAPSRAPTIEGHPKKSGGAYSEYQGEDGVPISAVNTSAYLTPKCIACANNCDPGVFKGAEDSVGCILGIFALDFSSCESWANLTTEQELCIEGCNANPACLGQLCLGNGTQPQSSVSAIPTCDKQDVCIKGAPGYCCPKGYPNVCPGNFSNSCPSYEAGCTPDDFFNNFCCAENAVCVNDPHGYLKGGWGSYQLCCPKDRVCGKKVETGKFPHFEGKCCPPGEVCTESAGYSGGGKTAEAQVCCEPKAIRKGKCCPGNWCGDHCCDGPCNGDKCGEACLSGRTTDGKCCTTGVPCGKKCCEGGCADAKTSTCQETKNCAKGKTYCAHRKTGAMGCWPEAQCQATPPLK